MKFLLNVCLVASLAGLGLTQDSGFRYPSHASYSSEEGPKSLMLSSDPRRSFERDGLLVSPSLMPHYASGGDDGPYPTIPPHPLLTSRQYPPMPGPMAYSPAHYLAHQHPHYPHSGFMPHSEGLLGTTPPPHMMMMSGNGEPMGPYHNPMNYGFPYGPMGLAHMSPMMSPSMYHQYYPRLSPGNYYYGGSPKIEIGQKLSNSIYANSDSLRYDLSSMQSNRGERTTSSPSYSASINSQMASPHGYSAHSSTYPNTDYAMASNGYRQYLSHSYPGTNTQALLANPQLYGRISQYLPYLTAGKYQSLSTSLAEGSNSRGQDSSTYAKAAEYLKSAQSASLSSATSHSAAASSASATIHKSEPNSQSSKLAASSPHEEVGFFKRKDTNSNGKTN